MNWVNHQVLKGIRILAAWGSLAIGVFCFLLVAGMIYEGGPWAHLIYAERPIAYLFGGFGGLFVFYLFSYGVRNSSRDWLRFAGKAVLMAFSLIFSLFTAEIGLRVYYSCLQNANSMERFKVARTKGTPQRVHSTHALAAIIQPSNNPKVIYELQPGLDMEFGGKHLITNSEGLRETNEYSVARSPHSFRVIGVGDSGMFGWDVDQGGDYLSVLEESLNARRDGISYEVLNLAVPGYNTQLEVETLRDKGLKYKPDLVIVGWCENDWSLPFFLLEKENYRRWNISFLYNLLFKRAGRNDNRTEVAPGFVIRDQRDFDESLVVSELTDGSDVDRVRKALVELKALSEQNGFKVLVFGPMKSLICQLCTEVGIPFSRTYDLIPDGTCPKEYLVYFMHPAPAGHRVLAEALEKDLDRRGWLTATGSK